MVQSRRNKQAALKLMRKLLKEYGFVPDKLVTDELRSYAAAAGHLGIAKTYEPGQWRNNRAENSHQPTRQRERKMQGFKSPGQLNDFSPPTQPLTRLSMSSAISPQHFRAAARRTTGGTVSRDACSRPTVARPRGIVATTTTIAMKKIDGLRLIAMTRPSVPQVSEERTFHYHKTFHG